MKKTPFLALLLACSLGAMAQTASSLTDYVEPRIGTAHCRSFHFAPGSMPFGMAKPGPSTNGSLGNADGWQATGYDYRDKSIEGFVCTHEFQVGGITVAPATPTERGRAAIVPALHTTMKKPQPATIGSCSTTMTSTPR